MLGENSGSRMQNEDVFVGGFEVVGVKLCWGILCFESF